MALQTVRLHYKSDLVTGIRIHLANKSNKNANARRIGIPDLKNVTMLILPLLLLRELLHLLRELRLLQLQAVLLLRHPRLSCGSPRRGLLLP